MIVCLWFRAWDGGFGVQGFRLRIWDFDLSEAANIISAIHFNNDAA